MKYERLEEANRLDALVKDIDRGFQFLRAEGQGDETVLQVRLYPHNAKRLAEVVDILTPECRERVVLLMREDLERQRQAVLARIGEL